MIPLDLSDVKEIELVLEALQQFVKRKVPARFGLVPTVSSTTATDQAKIAHYLLESYGLSGLFSYLEAVSSSFDLSRPVLFVRFTDRITVPEFKSETISSKTEF